MNNTDYQAKELNKDNSSYKMSEELEFVDKKLDRYMAQKAMRRLYRIC